MKRQAKIAKDHTSTIPRLRKKQEARAAAAALTKLSTRANHGGANRHGNRRIGDSGKAQTHNRSVAVATAGACKTTADGDKRDHSQTPCAFWNTGKLGRTGRGCDQGRACPFRHDAGAAAEIRATQVLKEEAQRIRGLKRACPISKTATAKVPRLEDREKWRLEGVLSKWNQARGFGFITPGINKSSIFVHLSGVESRRQEPREGGRASYNVAPGPKRNGSTKAVMVRLYRGANTRTRGRRR